MSNAMMSISGGVANLRGGKVAKRATVAKAARADSNNEVRRGLSLLPLPSLSVSGLKALGPIHRYLSDPRARRPAPNRASHPNCACHVIAIRLTHTFPSLSFSPYTSSFSSNTKTSLVTAPAGLAARKFHPTCLFSATAT